MASNSLELARLVPMFKVIPAEALRQLMRTSELKVMPAKAPLFAAGDAATGAYLPVTASVGLGLPGAEKPDETYGPGQLIGELALLTPVVRMHDATVISAGEILHIPRSEFARILEAHPQVAALISEQLKSSLRATTRDLMALKNRFLDGS